MPEANVTERTFSHRSKIAAVMPALEGDVLRVLGTLTVLLSCVGCPTGGGTPSPVDLAAAPAVPAVTVVAKVADCAPLAALPETASERVRALRPAVEAARAVSCTPEVFGMSDADARAALNVAAGLKLGLSRNSARIELAEGARALDFAAALGLESPKMKAKRGGRHTRWQLVASDGSVPTLWGVGELSVHLAPSAGVSDEQGDVVSIPPESTILWDLRVVIPEGTLRFEVDTHAAGVVTNALLELSKDPSLLKMDPDVAHSKLPMLGDRFDLTKWSSSQGTEGFHVRPRRTELLASDFAAQMKLSSPAYGQIEIEDADPERLANGGETTFEWQGLQLEVEIEEIEGGGSGLEGWRVEWIEVGPKPAKPAE